MLTPQFVLPIAAKLIVDIFAGGGGMSTALEQAFGRHIDIAINHDADALSMHQVNHPQTRHLISDVWEVKPRVATCGQPVGWLHLSPDCTDHSQAKGGQPRNTKIRALAWVAVMWAGTVKPDIISLENVVQILKWGRLIAKRDPATRRVVTLDMVRDPATGKTVNRVADKGERVPVERQYLIPDPKDVGRRWRRLVAILRAQGYVVEWRALDAAKYGAGSKRVRLFAIGRRDGQPIVWPEATHVEQPSAGQQRAMVAAVGIDWTIEGKSVFNRERPLAEATMRRIATGMKRFVLDSADPFIVPIANWSREATHSVREPLRTITARPRGGSHALLAPVLIQAGYGERKGQRPRALDLGKPLGVVTAGGVKHALSTAFLAQANGGFNTTPARDMRRPASTITKTGSQQQLVTAHMTTLRQNSVGSGAGDALSTICAGAQHHGLVEYDLYPDDEAGALRVAAFLMRYHGSGGQWGDVRDPSSTITTRDRLALVTVYIQGTPYVVVDIRLRMLTPRELFRLQGFPESYIIDRGHDGRVFSKATQVHAVGNSVSPPPAFAFISANLPPEERWRMTA